MPTEQSGKLSRGFQPVKKEGDSRKKKYICNSTKVSESRVSQGGNGRRQVAGREGRSARRPGCGWDVRSRTPC